MMLDGLNAQCRGDMGLAGARTADQHDIVGDVDKVAAVKLPDQRLIDLAAGKVEAGEIAIGREPRHLELIGRSEEHTSELQSLMRISYAVFCLKKKKQINTKKA